MHLGLKMGIALGLGALCGAGLGERAQVLGELGKVLIQLIKLLALPLLLLAIVDAGLRHALGARELGRLLRVCLVNAALALGIGAALAAWLRPGDSLRGLIGALPASGAPPSTIQLPEWNFSRSLQAYLPQDLVTPFRDQAVIPVILLALAAAWGMRRALLERGGDPARSPAAESVSLGLRTVELLLGALIRVVPIAVFGVVAASVGRSGLAALGGLVVYLGVGLLGLAVHVAIVYGAWVKFVLRLPLAEFARRVRAPFVYALGASSSLATLPVTLAALRSAGVPDRPARLAACVGTNLNNDGILLYEAFAALCVAQAHGIDLSAGQMLQIGGVAAVAGFGIAGVPDAGLISLAVVLTQVGLPLELVPALLTVDWIFSRARAAVNVTSDVLVAHVLARDGA